MTIGELCTRGVVVMEREESVLTAARLMREHHVGDVVVVNRGAQGGTVPVGIITDRDIVLEVVAAEVDPESVAAGDLMTTGLISLEQDADVLDATNLMRQHGVRRLVVVDGGGELVGVVAMDDVVDLLAEELGNISRLVARQRERESATRPPR